VPQRVTWFEELGEVQWRLPATTGAIIRFEATEVQLGMIWIAQFGATEVPGVMMVMRILFEMVEVLRSLMIWIAQSEVRAPYRNDPFQDL